MQQSIKCSGEFPRLNIPVQNLRLKKERNILKVFDPLRKRFFILTPEEFVRQQFISWLWTDLHYPTSLMANEIGIELNGTKRRCDTVVFDIDGTYLMIIEYKAPDIIITQEVFDQIVRYNHILRAKFLIVSNGLKHYCCIMDYIGNTYRFLKSVPDYIAIKTKCNN